jgi:hypothetical protein
MTKDKNINIKNFPDFVIKFYANINELKGIHYSPPPES